VDATMMTLVDIFANAVKILPESQTDNAIPTYIYLLLVLAHLLQEIKLLLQIANAL
jgi:hypothetical protein